MTHNKHLLSDVWAPYETVFFTWTWYEPDRD